MIGAVQNVADALRALQNDADALRAARDFERAAKISFDLARQQMQTGNANVLLLLNRHGMSRFVGLSVENNGTAGSSR